MNKLLLLQPEVLRRNRDRQHDESVAPALGKLLIEAKAALETGPFSVSDKTVTPPSGDKRDYMSVGPYWWSNPAAKNGLPYVRRDGEVNPDVENWDRPKLHATNQAVRTLSLAYFFTQEERYATHAAKLLRVFFLDEATRMNPNLNYGQAIPGKTNGRGIGIIETAQLVSLPDSVALLRSSSAWTARDDETLRCWFAGYVTWLQESKNGRDEAGERNNHGTWYDAQLAVFALFVGQPEIAKGVLREVLQCRISSQIEPDGSQPHELARTRTWTYSTMNLQGLFNLALAGENLEFDLWSEQTEDGRGLRVALDFLAQYADKPWPYPELGEHRVERVLPLLYQGVAKWSDDKYRLAIQSLPQNITQSDRTRLLFEF